MAGQRCGRQRRDRVTLTSGALLTLNADGSFTYDPNGQFEDLDAGETDTDTFTYKANDGTADSNEATVTITITGVNDAPVAVDDTGTTDEDTALLVSDPGVLGNDTDAEGDTLTVAEVEGSTPNVGTYVNLTDGGKVNVASDGSFTFDPDGDFEDLGTGESRTTNFTYKANDGDADSNEATVTITINGVNDAPVAVNDTGTTDEDTALTVPADGVLDNDTDAEGDTLSVAEVNGVVASVGTEITLASGALLTLNADGSYTYDPNGQFESLDDGESDTDTFTYKANDGYLRLQHRHRDYHDQRRERRAGRGRRHRGHERGHEPVGGSTGRARQRHGRRCRGPVRREVNGVVANVGIEITLGSGAKVTLERRRVLHLQAQWRLRGPRHRRDGSDSFTYKASDGTATSNEADRDDHDHRRERRPGRERTTPAPPTRTRT